MYDEIRIEELEVFAKHGVFPEENTLGQKFLVNVIMKTDVTKAAKGDDIHSSVHYGNVCAFISDYMRNNTFKLIETVAEHIATELLLKYNLIKEISVEIKKPWAPIGLPVESVSVKVNRGWHRVFIALGSNMGDKEEYLRGAVSSLEKANGCSVKKVSSFIVTEPYGGVEQDDFLNGVLELKTYLRPYELLELLHSIENAAGRKREIHWGPRTLDLDILLYDDIKMNEEDLTIPHPDMKNRDFVIGPLKEIAPYLVL
ncbi:MAG: 2-amino-4-hydroxy-6-hydroxymethyldihydropteridine diphosphokinase [Eubacterium sp.]|nr:2-amino-4-hydroxy-6-hydroxymethyldihydropteridine diphosphokinase [Eubacterium sp.]